MLNRDDSEHELSHLGEPQYGLDDEQLDAVEYGRQAILLKYGIANTLERFRNNHYQFDDEYDRAHIDFIIAKLIEYFRVVDKFEEQFLDAKLNLIMQLLAEENAKEDDDTDVER